MIGALMHFVKMVRVLCGGGHSYSPQVLDDVAGCEHHANISPGTATLIGHRTTCFRLLTHGKRRVHVACVCGVRIHILT